MDFKLTDLTDAEAEKLGFAEEIKLFGVPIEAAVNESRSLILIYLGSPRPEVRDYMAMMLVWDDGQEIGVNCNWGTEQWVGSVRHVEMKVFEVILPVSLEQARARVMEVLRPAIFALMGLDEEKDVLSLTDLGRGC